MTTGAGVFLWTFSPTPLVCVSVPVSGPHCLDDCSFLRWSHHCLLLSASISQIWSWLRCHLLRRVSLTTQPKVTPSKSPCTTWLHFYFFIFFVNTDTSLFTVCAAFLPYIRSFMGVETHLWLLSVPSATNGTRRTGSRWHSQMSKWTCEWLPPPSLWLLLKVKTGLQNAWDNSRPWWLQKVEGGFVLTASFRLSFLSLVN